MRLLSVHAGAVVVHDTGTGAPEITGEALTVVTRLESVTPPGQIIVTRDILSRRQHARAWELRATLALSQWLARHGQAAEGHSRLDRISRQFDEGLSTPDLLAAAAQLRALEQAAG